ncbi:hypothetical protein HCA58_21660 [Micromonospora sp. HNM0581]|uniref:hypothetical protein n=1 Tax=Micromonospora sp. HNM0581 TaxID=2716341 RepID=UPI00146AFE03|nr:hypothetical protein [Micromonospora sp. HNM0581]NLU80917.1 hypothetical protein [Micromonospora sp. HNM0581]
MPTRTPALTAWTPAFVADVVAAVIEHAAVYGLHQAARDIARSHGLSPATVEEWVSRARAVQATPVPLDLLACHTCTRSMILIQLPGCGRAYLCAPSCGRTPVPADEIRDAVAAVVLHRTPHLVPTGKTTQAASYALGPIQRVTVGATGTDLHITWRAVSRQITGPMMAMAQRLHLAQRHAAGNKPERAIDVLHSGLLHIDPTSGRLALDTATARAAALLATLAVVLHEHGRQEPAQQLLARTIADHRRVHPHHPAIARMTAVLYRMHTTATGPPGHPTHIATSATPGTS